MGKVRYRVAMPFALGHTALMQKIDLEHSVVAELLVPGQAFSVPERVPHVPSCEGVRTASLAVRPWSHLGSVCMSAPRSAFRKQVFRELLVVDWH